MLSLVHACLKNVEGILMSQLLLQSIPCTVTGVASGKVTAIPVHAWIGPEGSMEVEVPRFQNKRHMKLLRMSAICNSRLYLPVNNPGTYFCLQAELNSRAILVPEGLRQ